MVAISIRGFEKYSSCYEFFLYTELHHTHRRDGLVVRASASRSGGRGFELRPGHTKDFKNGTYCLLVRRSAFKNGEGKLNTRSYQWTNPLLQLSLHFSRCVA